MRKLLTNPFIFLVWILLVWGILFNSAKKTSGFSWFGLWTQQKNNTANSNIYVQKSAADQVVVDTLQAHAIIARGVSTLPGIWWNGSTQNTIPWYLAASQQLLMTDIVTYLENASDREAALDTLIAQLEYYQNYGNQYTQSLQEIIATSSAEYTRCTDAKTEADSIFYQGLREWNATSVQQWLDDAKTNAACQATNRVVINAHKAMLQRIEYNATVTTNLLQLLTQNRETIIAHFMLFKDTYLEKLITVRDGLRQASPWTAN